MLRWFSSFLLVSSILISCTPIVPTTPAPQPTALPTSPPETNPSPSKMPSPSPETQHRTVLLISWDGGRADYIYNWIADGTLPNFAALVEQGLFADFAITVTPSLTAPAQNSISTGSYPARTGIVSNAFHIPNDSFYWYRKGFDEILDNAEPVWVTASRAGLKTAALFFVGGSPTHPKQSADYTIGYGIRDSYSRQHNIALTPVTHTWQGEIPVSYSPPHEGDVSIFKASRVFLYALDSSDDNRVNYDTVILNTQRLIDMETPRLGIGMWGSLTLLKTNNSVADFLIQNIKQGESSLEIKLFHSGVYHNIAAPRELLETLNQKFGFFPAGPDSYALEHGWITPEENLYLLERAARWMAEVTAWVHTEYHPDLIYTWQNGFDAAGHAYLLQDSRQLNYSTENVEQYAGYYRRAAKVADQALQIIIDSIDLNHTTIMCVSDHGMAPIHTNIYVNTILEQSGLLTLDEKDYVVINKSKAIAFVSGGSAHIYINLEDHEKNGIVTTQEYPQIQQQIIDLLSSLTDPQTGDKVFQHVYHQEELKALHLDHPHSGDVFAQAVLGYTLDGWRGKDIIFEPTDYYGQHGYDSNLPEMRAFFIAAGSGVPILDQAIPPVQVVDYAPTIAALLGFIPAETVDGTHIQALVDYNK